MDREIWGNPLFVRVTEDRTTFEQWVQAVECLGFNYTTEHTTAYDKDFNGYDIVIHQRVLEIYRDTPQPPDYEPPA